MDPESHITQLLQDIGKGDRAVAERLWSAVYDELHRMARRQMASEPSGQTLQPTALIHELYLRLFDGRNPACDDRKHFFALAAKAMRQIRIDAARRRKRLKRAGKGAAATAWDEPPIFDSDPTELLAVNEALDKLAENDQRKAQVVELRYFGGLSIDECAAALGVSPRTVDNEWRFARAWLHQELSGQLPGD